VFNLIKECLVFTSYGRKKYIPVGSVLSLWCILGKIPTKVERDSKIGPFEHYSTIGPFEHYSTMLVYVLFWGDNSGVMVNH